MREILFRGKSEYNGEWVFGSLHIEYGETDRDGNRNLDHRILGVRGECYYVIPETVGQFVGVSDKNGKKIFEGDIIRTDNGKQSAVSVVKYGDFRPKMIFRMFRDFIGYEPPQSMHGAYCETLKEQMALFNSPTCIEVIDNIHDNPELMEDE